MIRPINKHILIEPLVHKSFMDAGDTYEEIGVVVDFDPLVNAQVTGTFINTASIEKGMRVYFDSWLAAKFPGKEKGKYLWMVKHEDIRAVETED